jgi:hypothetical protein
MKKINYLLALTILVSSQVLSATEVEIKFYDVELIIFKNDKGPKGQEYILPESSPRVEGNVLDLSSPKSIKAAKKSSYEIIPLGEMRLTETALSIVDSDRYSLLAHVAWRQPGVEKDKALPVWVKGGRVFGEEFISIDNQIDSELLAKTEYLNAQNSATLSASGSSAIQNPTYTSGSILYELEGTITIGLSRYLHTYADLVLRKPRLTIEPSAEISELDQSSIENLPDTRILNNHSLRERRRMRSNKLHYLDSPEFSMLILITPYEPPEVENTTGMATSNSFLALSEIGQIPQ